MIIKKEILKEIKSLEQITKKQNLLKYYNICYQKIPIPDYATQFEHNEFETLTNGIVIDFIRDYALFNEDNSDLLRNYDPNNDNPSSLYQL